jgi:hypothetical protein
MWGFFVCTSLRIDDTECLVDLDLYIIAGLILHEYAILEPAVASPFHPAVSKMVYLHIMSFSLLMDVLGSTSWMQLQEASSSGFHVGD